MGTYLSGISPSAYTNNISSGYGTGFSLSNYTNLSSGTDSIFGGYGNTGLGNNAVMAPQQQQNDSSSMMQMVMMLLMTLLQGGGQAVEEEPTETVIDDADEADAAPAATAAAAAVPQKEDDNTGERVAAGILTGGASEIFGGW